MKKQTAVEWLYNTLIVTPIDQKKWEDIYKQAKAMEKEQIINAYDNGYGMGDFKLTYEDIEIYYNETYNK